MQLTTKKAAEHCGVHQSTIKYWHYKKFITGKKDGHDLMFDATELDKFLATHSVYRGWRRGKKRK